MNLQDISSYTALLRQLGRVVGANLSTPPIFTHGLQKPLLVSGFLAGTECLASEAIADSSRRPLLRWMTTSSALLLLSPGHLYWVKVSTRSQRDSFRCSYVGHLVPHGGSGFLQQLG